MVNVLLSSAGRRVGLLQAFRDTFADLNVVGAVLTADSSVLAPAAWYADERYTVPFCDDPTFIPTMLDICERQRVRLLVPTIDTELAVYAEHRDAFTAIGTLVAVSGPETIDIASDKRNTHRFLQDRGLPTVRQASSRQVLTDRSAWQYPFVVKPARGSASNGVVVVHNDTELLAATQLEDSIVQELAVGQEYTVDVFVDRVGAVLGCVPRERLETRAGEVSKGRTVRLPVVEELAAQVAKGLPNAMGVLNVQLFYDDITDAVQVIEINPRFGGGFPLSHQAGAPFTRWLLETALGRDPSPSSERWRDGVTMLRFDEAVYLEADRLQTWRP